MVYFFWPVSSTVKHDSLVNKLSSIKLQLPNSWTDVLLFAPDCGRLTLSLPECLMEFCKVTLTFESMDEILWCDHSNESSLPVLSHNAIFFSSKFQKMKFANLVEICFWPHLAVKGLKGLCHKDTADIAQFCAQLFSSFNPCPSLPFVATDDRGQFQFLNIVR